MFAVQVTVITNSINVYCANTTSKRSHFASEFSAGEAFTIRSENIPEIADFLTIEIPLIFFGIIGYSKCLILCNELCSFAIFKRRSCHSNGCAVFQRLNIPCVKFLLGKLF